MVFATKSPLGYVVVYTESARAHTESGHPEMAGHVDAIQLAVEDPVAYTAARVTPRTVMCSSGMTDTRISRGSS